MWNNLKVLSITHKTAVIDIREMVRLTEPQTKSFLLKVKDLFDMEDVWVLSTPDRTEIFYRYDKEMKNELVWLVCQTCNIANWRSYLNCFQSVTDHSDAVVYFLEVSTGMHSAIPGDRDVFRQMKAAFAASQEVAAGTIFQDQLKASMNRVADRLKMAEVAESPSLGSAAAMLAQQILRDQKEEPILILGSGEGAEEIVRDLLGYGYSELSLADSDPRHAETLANAMGINCLPWDRVRTEVNHFKMVLSDHQGDHPVVLTEDFNPRHRHVNQYFIDLAVKRSIDPFISCMDGKFIFNVDVLRDSTAGFFIPDHDFQTQTQKVICEEFLSFLSNTERFQSSSAMLQFRNVLENLRKSAIAIHQGQMSKEGMEILDKVTETMVAGISELPVAGLRSAPNKERDAELLDALGTLFGFKTGSDVLPFKDTGAMGMGRKAC